MTNENDLACTQVKAKASIELLKKLREQTQLGYTECQKALLQAKNNEEKALLILKSKSLIAAGKRLDRKVNEGTIASYVHKSPKTSAKEGVLLQLGCETSFVANLAEFTTIAQNLARALYQHKANYLYFEDIPNDLWLAKFNLCLSEIEEKNSNLSIEEQKQLALNELRKLFSQEVLMAQKLDLMDGASLSVEDYIGSQIGIFKENIKIVRFVNFQI